MFLNRSSKPLKPITPGTTLLDSCQVIQFLKKMLVIVTTVIFKQERTSNLVKGLSNNMIEQAH
jgi:hypothetical protein